MSEPVPEPDGFTIPLTAEVSGVVEHHAPCVPECPVCYPESEAP